MFWLVYFRGLFRKSSFSYFYFSSFSICSAVLLKLESVLLRITYALAELQHFEWYIKLLVLKITRGPGMGKNSISHLAMRSSRHWKQWKIPVIGPGVHVWLNGQTVNISKQSEKTLIEEFVAELLWNKKDSEVPCNYENPDIPTNNEKKMGVKTLIFGKLHQNRRRAVSLLYEQNSSFSAELVTSNTISSKHDTGNHDPTSLLPY